MEKDQEQLDQEQEQTLSKEEQDRLEKERIIRELDALREKYENL